MKRIVVSVLLSFLGPGLGQIYNKDYKKGTVLLALSFALFILPTIWLIKKVAPFLPDPSKGPVSQEMIQNIILQAIGNDRHILNLVSFLFLGVWAYAISQAYFKAKEINEKESASHESEGHA